MKEREIAKAKTLEEWANSAIEKHFQKTLKHEEDVLKDRDPEALHQMRVAMRRLRSAVTGFAVALDLPKSAQDKKIAKIARRLGKLRDLDVLLEAIEKDYKLTLPTQEQDLLDKVLVELSKQRREVLEEVRETLKHQRYKSLKQALKEWLKKPTYQEIAILPIQQVLPDLLLPQVSELFLHPGWLVGMQVEDAAIERLNALKPKAIEEYLILSGPSLHSLRKQVKRVRYQMSLFSDLYGSAYGAYLDEMKAIQEVLGEIQDSLVLAEMLTDVLKEEMESKLPSLAIALMQTRFQAWEKWKPLQQRYLNPETRYAFREELQQPLPPTTDKELVTLGRSDGA